MTLVTNKLGAEPEPILFRKAYHLISHLFANANLGGIVESSVRRSRPGRLARGMRVFF